MHGIRIFYKKYLIISAKKYRIYTYWLGAAISVIVLYLIPTGLVTG